VLSHAWPISFEEPGKALEKNVQENYMRRAILLLYLMGVILGFGTGSAGADTCTFPDITDTQQWNLGGPYGSGPWVNTIGNANTYETFGANLSGNILTFTTNWNPNKKRLDDPAAVTADLFINKGNASDWNYAIQLNTLNGTGKVYANPSYKTSYDLFKGS
jgi:hypothetical protein